MSEMLTRTIATAAIGTSGLTAVAALPVVTAGAATGPVNITKTCSGSSIVNLQLHREHGGKLSVDFGVDVARHKAGVTWKVALPGNGTAFVNGTTRTRSAGSVSYTHLTLPTIYSV